MILSKRIEAFIKLGRTIQNLDEEAKEELYWRSQNGNNWFTQESVSSSLEGIVFMLQEDKLKKWLGEYEIKEEVEPKSVGVLMAGNIPLVGFHDLMTVLISGNKACVKLSSSDTILMNWVINQLIQIEPEFKSFISVEEMLKGKDAYIATGSDNSARYFNYYFGKYPSIIRQNRTSIAILSGEETPEDLKNLGKDIFKYFGLGCRNVSKIFVKSKEQLEDLLDALEGYASIANHHKYHNNYEYNKSIYLVNNEPHLDNGFLILKESKELVSPISVLYYEIYDSKNDLLKKLESIKEKIQCIVADSSYWGGGVFFGCAQQPEPWDYADEVDTMEFLIGLN
ncbi:acyl-CoA reductase [Algoriphagus halophilus]|uniref:Acyl-CoA reductase (LuxC) n=1 Tax=Algoriphagus halophilus TaxID=226505 RepID=A0A1N6DED2_9BACT|nr:acyl-CoA reductase [Algoriphagus halophilus]SIN69142.1 Acyl-CoA reductase (LuxC) [Algoriphagus halophilus]